jgi:hypothetical protein
MAVWAPDEVLAEYAQHLETKHPEDLRSIADHERHFGAAILAFRRELGFKDSKHQLTPERVALIFKAGWQGPI